MTALLAWRKRMRWPQRRAAAELGVALTTYQAWEAEARRDGTPLAPPRTALLAAAALESGLAPVGIVDGLAMLPAESEGLE